MVCTFLSPLKFICWKPNAQSGNIRRQGHQEAVRAWGQSSHEWDECPSKRGPREVPQPFYPVDIQWEVKHLSFIIHPVSGVLLQELEQGKSLLSPEPACSWQASAPTRNSRAVHVPSAMGHAPSSDRKETDLGFAQGVTYKLGFYLKTNPSWRAVSVIQTQVAARAPRGDALAQAGLHGRKRRHCHSCPTQSPQLRWRPL